MNRRTLIIGSGASAVAAAAASTLPGPVVAVPPKQEEKIHGFGMPEVVAAGLIYWDSEANELRVKTGEEWETFQNSRR